MSRAERRCILLVVPGCRQAITDQHVPLFVERIIASRYRAEYLHRSITKRKNKLKNGVAQSASREHEDKLFGGRRCRPLDDRNYRQSHSDNAHACRASRQFLSVTLPLESLFVRHYVSLVIRLFYSRSWIYEYYHLIV